MPNPLPMPWSQHHPGIFVDSTDIDFMLNALIDLNKIFAFDLGRDLLELISKRHTGVGTAGGKKVTIVPAVGRNAEAMFNNTAASAKRIAPARRKTISIATKAGDGITGPRIDVADDPYQMSGPGAGSGVTVRYVNRPTQIRGRTIIPDVAYGGMSGVTTPRYLALAHELIHAFHVLSGTVRDTDEEEEDFTIGLGNYAEGRLTENKMRTSLRLPLRTQH
jgi:hypothetical protein